MAIEAEYIPERQSGNGSTSAFDFDFQIYSENDVAVYFIDKTTEVATLKELGVDYEVDFEVGTAGGTINILTDVPTADEWILPLSNLSNIQSTAFPEGRLNSRNIERMGDRLCRLVQQVVESTKKALTFSATSAVSEVSIDSPVNRRALVMEDIGGGNYKIAMSGYDPDTQVTLAEGYATAAASSASAASSSATAAEGFKDDAELAAGTAAASAATITFRVSEETYVDGDLSTGVLTPTPPSGTTEIVSYTLYDNSGDQYLPDGSTDTTIDLTSFGTLTGTHTFKGLWK